MEKIKLRCPAKINLTLKVLNKREDGFHNIDSVMQTISLYDYLTIAAKKSDCIAIKLSGTSDEIPYNEKNLVYKAAKLFLDRVGFSAEIEIFIEKNIPVSAGLAGGSTDAAGALYGLNELFEQPLSRTELHELCAKLGSDLNFCLEGGRQKTSGRGEILESLPFEEFSVSLIKPVNLGISAKEAYTKFSAKLNTSPHLASPAEGGGTENSDVPQFNNRASSNNSKQTPTTNNEQQIPSPLIGVENSENNLIQSSTIDSTQQIPPPRRGRLGGGDTYTTKQEKKSIRNIAKQLRKSMTDAEKILWFYLQKKQFHNLKFRRQQPIGNYIVDFACLEKNIIIELDGGQHNETHNIEYDAKRDEFLKSHGFKVIRIWNNEIFENIDGVLEYLERAIAPHLTSPAEGGGTESCNVRTQTLSDDMLPTTFQAKKGGTEDCDVPQFNNRASSNNSKQTPTTNNEQQIPSPLIGVENSENNLIQSSTIDSTQQIPPPRRGRLGGGDTYTTKQEKKSIRNIAKQLRKSMTDAEKILWFYLQKKQFHNLKFRRQQPIGNYIVDFACLEKNIIIELDGGQHNETHNIEYDAKRDEFLKSHGFKVIRIWNNEIFENIDGVLEYLERAIAPHLTSPAEGGGTESCNVRTQTLSDDMLPTTFQAKKGGTEDCDVPQFNNRASSNNSKQTPTTNNEQQIPSPLIGVENSENNLIQSSTTDNAHQVPPTSEGNVSSQNSFIQSSTTDSTHQVPPPSAGERIYGRTIVRLANGTSQLSPQGFQASLREREANPRQVRWGASIAASRNDFQNDLEWAVIDDYNELQTIKNKYPSSIMSGSGSTCFLINGEFCNSDNFWVKNNLKSIPTGIEIVFRN